MRKYLNNLAVELRDRIMLGGSTHEVKFNKDAMVYAEVSTNGDINVSVEREINDDYPNVSEYIQLNLVKELDLMRA